MKILRPILLVLLGAVLAVALPRCGRIFGHWKCIQILETQDHAHTVKLYRLYGYIDVNFRIELDGKRIYWSPDCAPDKSLPFRETMAWDETGNILVFQLAGRNVYAYNLVTSEAIAPELLKGIKTPRITLNDIGFEGRHQFEQEEDNASNKASEAIGGPRPPQPQR